MYGYQVFCVVDILVNGTSIPFLQHNELLIANYLLSVRASLRMSCSHGALDTFSAMLVNICLSTMRELACVRATVTASMQLHLRSKATAAECLKKLGTVSARATANCLKESAVS